VLCYSVKIEIPSEADQPESVYYLVRTNSEAAAPDAVLEGLPTTWRVASVTPAAVRSETVEALDRPLGVPRLI
jgi:hypothetical protein